MDLRVSLFLLLCFCSSVSPSNILVVSPIASNAHTKVGDAIAVGLANAGHNVTILSTYDFTRTNLSNLEFVQITDAFKIAQEFQNKLEWNDLKGFQPSSLEVMIPKLSYLGSDLCNATLMYPKVQNLFNRQFDLVIVEIFATDSLIGLGQLFDAPVIGFSPLGTTRWTDDLMGNVSPLSHVPHAMLVFPNKMNFFNRMYNAVFHMYESLVLTFLHHPLQRSVYNQAFPNAKMSYDEARKNVSLVFVNSHFSLGMPLPRVPNVIEIGGIHVDRETHVLRWDIENFIDKSMDGAVLFSFGTVLKPESMSIDKRKAFIKAFTAFKQSFLWRYEHPTFKMTSNVLTRRWLPQADILSHPNVKAFITHASLLDTMEAAYHGVPILAIPFFNDQKINAKRASEAGWAVTLDYHNISASSVEWALREILQDKYLQNARTVSKRYRDQPMTPTETMVYWSEYVIRHKGAPHMRSNVHNLNSIEYYNADVLAVFACIFALFVYAIVWTFQKRTCCRRSTGKMRLEERTSKKRR